MTTTRRDFLRMSLAAMAVPPSFSPAPSVLLSFDGGYPLAKWRSTLALGDELSRVTPAHFTYFLVGAMVTTVKGAPVGNNGGEKMTTERIALIQQAIDKGHEIACHTMHHFDGTHFGEQRWIDEIGGFDAIVGTLFHDAHGKPYKPVTFRAPYLAWNDAMFSALSRSGYRNDSSIIGTVKRKNGINELCLPEYRRANGRKMLSMDYNWNLAKMTDGEVETMLENALRAGDVAIGLHFNDFEHNRTYWPMAEALLRRNANKVKCVTVDESLR